MKYVKVEWPEIQDYMLNPRYKEEVSYDASKNCWFIPENWVPDDLGLDSNIEIE